MLTFQANYLSSATIERINVYKNCPKKVAFVEINPAQKGDVATMHKTAIKWDKIGGDGFAYDICKAINNGVKDRFFVLTTQSDNFDKLDHNQILSMAQVKTEKEGESFVEYLQVDPENFRTAENPEFRLIGTAMLNSLKKIFYNKSILLDSVRNAISFYLKNGFVDMGITDEGERRMLWNQTLESLH